MASYLKYTKIPTTVANDSLDTKSENCVLFFLVRITLISWPFCWLWLFINRRKVCNQYKIKIVYSIKRSLTVMYIKEQTVRRPNVNICKFTFCPIHYIHCLLRVSDVPPIRESQISNILFSGMSMMNITIQAKIVWWYEADW